MNVRQEITGVHTLLGSPGNRRMHVMDIKNTRLKTGLGLFGVFKEYYE